MIAETPMLGSMIDVDLLVCNNDHTQALPSFFNDARRKMRERDKTYHVSDITGGTDLYFQVCMYAGWNQVD